MTAAAPSTTASSTATKNSPNGNAASTSKRKLTPRVEEVDED